MTESWSAPGCDGMAKALWRRLTARVRRIPLWLRAFSVVMLLPLIEYAVLVWISDAIGFTLTLFLVLASGATGAWAVRQQGSAAWRRILSHVRTGDPVGEPIFDAVLVLLAGLLLIVPGVLSDLAGFALLLPRFRSSVRDRLSRWLRRKAMMQVSAFHADGRVTVEATPVAAEDGPMQVIDPEERRIEAGAPHG